MVVAVVLVGVVLVALHILEIHFVTCTVWWWWWLPSNNECNYSTCTGGCIISIDVYIQDVIMFSKMHVIMTLIL